MLKFATSKEQDGKLLETTGQMPIRTDLPTTYADYFSKNPEYKTFADQASRTVEVPNVPELGGDLAGDPRQLLLRGDLRQDLGRRRRIKEGGGQGRRARRPVVRRPVATLRAGLAAVLGRQPLGILFAAPYAVFLAAVFAYPLGLAVWISFHDYFFAAPGAQVDRPFVGFENYARC